MEAAESDEFFLPPRMAKKCSLLNNIPLGYNNEIKNCCSLPMQPNEYTFFKDVCTFFSFLKTLFCIQCLLALAAALVVVSNFFPPASCASKDERKKEGSMKKCFAKKFLCLLTLLFWSLILSQAARTFCWCVRKAFSDNFKSFQLSPFHIFHFTSVEMCHIALVERH